MASFYPLRVVTPERTVLADEVEMVVARGAAGELGILAGHVPLVTPLRIGVVRVHKEGAVRRVAVMGGFLEVGPGGVTILSPLAQLPEEIDVARARAARERAERRLNNPGPEVDVTRAQAALARAMARLEAAGAP